MMNTDLGWRGVEYDYERSQCCCSPEESICRCTKIVSTEITELDIKKVIETLIKTHCNKESIFLKYCFERLCYFHQIYNRGNYSVEVVGGYYGEEIGGVHFENENDVLKDFGIILNLVSDIDKIKYLLTLEYGYILDDIKNTSELEIKEITRDSLVIPQMQHYSKLDKNAIENYSKRSLPICVCIAQGDKYRLIDGYHRVFSNKDLDKLQVIVIK